MKATSVKPLKRAKPTITNTVNNVEGNGFSKEQDNDEKDPSKESKEQTITLAKKVKVKKVARKSLVKDRGPARDSASCLISTLRMEVELGISKITLSEFQVMCVCCAKEINTFLDLYY